MKSTNTSRHLGRARRRSVFVAMAVCLETPLALIGLPVAGGAPVHAALRSETTLVGSVARVPADPRRLGPLSSNRTIALGFALRPTDQASLSSYAAAVVTPSSPSFHQFLTPTQFATAFAPSKDEVSTLSRELSRAGFHVGAIPADRLLIPVTAKVGVVERALRTNLFGYKLASGQLGWAATAAPTMPSADANMLSAVLGLDNLVVPHSSLQARVSTLRQSTATSSVRDHVASDGAPSACSGAKSAASIASGWTQDDVAKAYGLSRLYAAGDLAAGQTIAVFELEPFLMSDIARFDRCFFGTSHTNLISVQNVDDFDLSGPGSGEATLDVENISALAPDAHLIVYESPNTTFGTLDQYAEIVSQDRANIVSTSWGECESALATGSPGSTQLENSLFEEAAVQGQTVFAAAGDDGSDDSANTPFGSSTAVQPYLSVDDPGAQPYVVSVGGTTLSSDVQPLAANAETVWNDGARAGSGGGGISNTWPIPTWQADSGVLGVGTSGNREVPDVSAAADQERGVTVYSAAFAPPVPSGLAANTTPPSGWTTIGGTSSATPIWAAIAAEIAASAPAGTSCNALSVTAGGADLGFLSPELYAVAGTHYAASFNDITSGDNDVFGLGLGYHAGVGYSLAAGLGSPIVTNPSGPGLAAYLYAAATGTLVEPPARPVITSISPTFGPTAGGGTVTLTLAGAPPVGATLHAEVGAVAATVVSASGQTVVLTVPAAPLTSSSQPFGGAGPAAITLTVSTSSGTTSSGTVPQALYDYVNEGGSATLPTITGVGPSGGNVAGDSPVTIYGSGFAPGPDTVTFGGVSASNVQVDSDYELTVTAPPEGSSTTCAVGAGFDAADNCQVEVVVSTSGGTSPVASILPPLSGAVIFNAQGVVAPTPETEVAPATTEYDYAPTPRISSITPNPADASGSQPVTINGSGFSLNTLDWVNFGPSSDSASEEVKINYISGSKIVVDPPGIATRSLKVLAGGASVLTSGGLSNVAEFGYAGIPTVTKISRHLGPATGGSRITITGLNLTGATSVDFVTSSDGRTFADSSSAEIVRGGSRSIVVISPAGLPGNVDVEPCTPSGCSRATPSTDSFLFYSVSPPRISSVRPFSGPATGGTIVTILGSNLAGALGVFFGTVEVKKFVRPNGYPLNGPTAVSVVAPPGNPGTSVRIEVVTHAGKTASLTGGRFSYRS